MHPLARVLACALAPVVLSACASDPGGRPDTAPSSALEDLGQPEGQAQAQQGAATQPGGGLSLADAARRSADDLTALLTGDQPMRAAPTPSPNPQQQPWQPPSARGTPGGGERREPETTDMPESQHAPDPQREPVAAERTDPAAPIEAPAADPIEAMLERLEGDSSDPKRALAAGMLSRALRAYADRDDGSLPSQDLSPPERELVEALAPLLEAMATGERADAPARIGRELDAAMNALADILPIRINDAALATDIYGYAAYRPFYSNAFLAGRSNRVLLYTEPAQFVSTPTAEPASQGSAANPGAYEVSLGLELRLFNERGSMLAWRRAEERVAIRSDRPRSEVYLGTLIDLPASLSVGRYQLKVIVRDLADGSEDERVIPIEIVADPRLTASSTRDR
ncbi:MAG: hypothetical protein RIB58_05405 [Phycisphaerales bacterium]